MGNQTRFQHRSQIRENEILKPLFRGIVEEQGTQHIARKRSDVMAFEPGTLAGSGKPDSEHH